MKWISVEDRLPKDDGEEVDIVHNEYVAGPSICTAVFNKFESREFKAGKFLRDNLDSDYDGTFEAYGVTHWKPRPDLPNEHNVEKPIEYPMDPDNTISCEREEDV